MKEQRPGEPLPLETPTQERLRTRLGSRLVLGGLIGAGIGAGLGLLVGVIWFAETGAIMSGALGGAVFGFGVGMLMLGYSSLESPDPGREPSDTARPIADRREAVREEHDRRPD
jgi:hypothetical protein